MDNVPFLLLNYLDELGSEELKRFQWHLVQDTGSGFRPIPRSKLEDANRTKTVEIMVQSFNTAGALKVTQEILKKIARNDLVSRLGNEILQYPEVVEKVDDLLEDQQAIEKKVLQLLKNCKPEDALRIIKTVQKDLNLDEVRKYAVTGKLKGICLIINNVDFKDIKDLEDREGSDIDAESLARVFSWMGFWVVMCKDKKKEEMEQVLQLVSKLNQLSELSGLSGLQLCGVKEWAGERRKFIDLNGLIQHGDVFVCCVLSHGVNRGIYGTDGQVLSTNDLLTPFIPSKCPALKEKPKLFFIQACRSDPEQVRIRKERERREQVSRNNMVNLKASAEIKRKRQLQPDCAGSRVKPQNAQEESPEPLYTIDEDSDFLVALATVDKRTAYRDTDNGSLFIQSLCLQLTQGCPRGDDILGILTRVNYQVSDSKENTPQMPEVKSRLRMMLVIPVPV